MKATCVYKYLVDSEVFTTRFSLTSLYKKCNNPSKSYSALIENLYKSGVDFESLPDIIPAKIKGIKGIIGKTKSGVMKVTPVYKCVLSISDVCISLAEDELFEFEDKDTIAKAISFSEKSALSDIAKDVFSAIKDVNKYKTYNLVKDIEYLDSVVLTSSMIPVNRFFDSSSIEGEIKCEPHFTIVHYTDEGNSIITASAIVFINNRKYLLDFDINKRVTCIGTPENRDYQYFNTAN